MERVAAVAPSAPDRLTHDELALEAETTPERIRRLGEPIGDVQISGLVEPMMLCRGRRLSQRSEE
jgi:hypothetical protein